MPDDARRDAAFYDHENEPRRHVADWGADDLFTRMPRRRSDHTPPQPRARRPAPLDPVHRPGMEPTGRFERLDGEVPSAGDVRPSGRRFASPDHGGSADGAAPPGPRHGQDRADDAARDFGGGERFARGVDGRAATGPVRGARFYAEGITDARA